MRGVRNSRSKSASMSGFQLLHRLYSQLGVTSPSARLEGKSIVREDVVLLVVTEGRVYGNAEHREAEYGSVLLRGFVHVGVMQGACRVRGVQRNVVQVLSDNMLGNGFSKMFPIMVGLAEVDPVGRHAWSMMVSDYYVLRFLPPCDRLWSAGTVRCTWPGRVYRAIAPG